MYQADPSVIISGKLGDKKKLFPSANVIMFLVLNEKALEDLKHNSDSLSHLHSQLNKETPVIICSKFSNYQKMEHAAEETKQRLLLSKKYDYLKANKFIASFYDINEEDLPAIVMVDAKRDGNRHYLQLNKFTSIDKLLIAVRDIASHFISSPSMTYNEFSNTQSKKYNFQRKINSTDTEINGIFNWLLQSLFDKSSKRVALQIISEKLSSPALQSHRKLVNVITSFKDSFSKKTNQDSSLNLHFNSFNAKFPHHILDSEQSGLNSYSQKLVSEASTLNQHLFDNMNEYADPATIYRAVGGILRPIIETELHASHFAFLRREVGVDIFRYYLTWDKNIGHIKYFNEQLRNSPKLRFPQNHIMYTKYQAKTGENQDVFQDALSPLNFDALHQNYPDQFEEALKVIEALSQDWARLAICLEQCMRVRKSCHLDRIYNEYKFQRLTTSTPENSQ